MWNNESVSAHLGNQAVDILLNITENEQIEIKLITEDIHGRTITITLKIEPDELIKLNNSISSLLSSRTWILSDTRLED